jgi:hypothetical protein
MAYNERQAPQAISKEVVGIHVLMPHSLSVTVFCVGRFGALLERDRLLLLCCVDGSAKRSLDLALRGGHSREKHTAEPVQFGTPPTIKKFPASFAASCRLT